MSAFVVDDWVIDGIIQAGLDFEPSGFTWYVLDDRGEPITRGHLDHTSADEVGQMLWAENCRSVNFRYGEETPTPRYTRHRMPIRLGPEHIPRLLGLLSMYEYQACECPDWRRTEAHAFCDSLRHALIHHLPGYRWPGREMFLADDDRHTVSVNGVLGELHRRRTEARG